MNSDDSVLESMPSLLRLATLKIQNEVTLNMLEEAVDKPEYYSNIVKKAYAKKINKKMIKDALESPFLNDNIKKYLKIAYLKKKRRLSRERPSLLKCYIAAHEYNYDDIQYLILLRFTVNKNTKSFLNISATDVAKLFIKKLENTKFYGRTDWTNGDSSGMELYTRKLNHEPSTIKSEANFVVLKDYGGGQVPGDIWEAQRVSEWDFEKSLDIVEDLVTELFDELDEWASYTTYENNYERFPNLLQRFIERTPGLDGVWEDSVENDFTHSFFTIERNYS